MVKLVRNNKIARFPKAKKTVKDALRAAVICSQKEGWDKVVIIGEGKKDVRSIYSNMSYYTAIGILEVEKAANVRDVLDS